MEKSIGWERDVCVGTVSLYYFKLIHFLHTVQGLNSIKRFSAVKQLKPGKVLIMWRPLQKTFVPITSKNSASVCTQECIESAGSRLKRNPARKTNANGISIFNNLNHGFGNSLLRLLIPFSLYSTFPDIFPFFPFFPSAFLKLFFLYTFLKTFSSLKIFFLQIPQAFFPFSLLKLSFTSLCSSFLSLFFAQAFFPFSLLKLLFAPYTFLPIQYIPLHPSFLPLPFPARSSSFSFSTHS
jgi:hypothetical protein